jgi:hypothetical protein
MMNRLKIAQYIAMAATVMSVAGFILESKDIGGGDYLIGLGLIMGLYPTFSADFSRCWAWR